MAITNSATGKTESGSGLPAPADASASTWTRRARLGGLGLGALCALGYVWLPANLDPAAMVAGRIRQFADANAITPDGGTLLQIILAVFRIVLKGLGPTYIRIVFWLLPALGLITWGWTGLVGAARVERLLAGARRHATLLAVGAALGAGLATHVISDRVLEGHPITLGDEFCYTFHAKLFASGRFHADPPPAAEPFRNRAFVTGERWYGIGFGGHPLALSVGVWLGSIRLVPTLCAGVSVLLTYLLVRELFDRAIGLLAAVMLALSPLFLFYHATLLPESTHLVLLLGFLWFLAKAVKGDNPWFMAGAAACIGLAVFTRPQTSFVFALPIGLWMVLRRDVTRRLKIRSALILSIGAALGVVGLLTYAHLVSGDPFGRHVSPGYHTDAVGGAAALGIADSVTFIIRCLTLAATFVKLNFVLLGWPLSLATLYLWWRWREKQRWDYLLFAAAALVFGFYWLYPVIHEQYIVEAGWILVVLGAAGLAAAYRRTNRIRPDAPDRHGLVCFVLAAYLLGAVSVWPLRVDYFTARSDHERAVWKPIRDADLHQAIVFLDGLSWERGNCVGANSPDLDDDVLLAKVESTDRIPAIARYFPERKPFRLYRDAENGRLKLEPYAPETIADRIGPDRRVGLVTKVNP